MRRVDPASHRLVFELLGGHETPIPALKASIAEGGSLAKIAIIEQNGFAPAPLAQVIVTQLLDPPDQKLRQYDELLRSELLQLATLMIRYM